MESKLKFCIMADNIIVDSNTGKMTAVGISNEIDLPKDKAEKTISLVVGGQIMLDPDVDSGELDIRILNPEGNLHVKETLRGAFEKGKDLQFVCHFRSVEFTKAGNYSVQFFLNGKKPAEDSAFPYFKVTKNG